MQLVIQDGKGGDLYLPCVSPSVHIRVQADNTAIPRSSVLALILPEQYSPIEVEVREID